MLFEDLWFVVVGFTAHLSIQAQISVNDSKRKALKKKQYVHPNSRLVDLE